MNNQEAFDLMVNHLITQGKPSVDEEGACMYRGQDNTMCAVGILIPDDKYTKAMECLRASHVARNFNLDLGEVEIEFLEQAQGALHDGPADDEWKDFVENVKYGARRLAREWKLKCSV